MNAQKLLLVILLAGLLLVIPAGAAETDTRTTMITAENVDQYSFTASPDHYIYEIIVDSLPVGTNQTHVLNFNDAVFLLDIRSTQSWVIYKDFTVSMTYPNSTVETINASTTSVFGTYKTKIQPVFTQLQGIPLLQISLAIGTNPTTVTFSDLEGILSSYDKKTSVPFTAVSGQFSGQTSTVYAYEISISGFDEAVTNDREWWKNLFDWTWDTVLGTIKMIPVIGPQLLAVMVFITDTGAEIIFWLTYIITNIWLVIAGVELLIIMFAFLLAGKRPTPERFVKNLVKYNIGAVGGFLKVLGILYGWLVRFVQMVAQIVQAIKPI